MNSVDGMDAKVTWDPMADPSGEAFRKHRRARRLCLMVAAILVAAITLVIVVLTVVRASPLTATVDGHQPNFELRDYLINNRPQVDRAEWIER